MPEPNASSVRTALRAALSTALKQRDRQAVAVYRAALGSIDNAEAVPPSDTDRAGAVESSTVGIGRADAPRRVLTERDMRQVVVREAEERCSAAALMTTAQPDAAEQLLADARLLRALLRGLETD